MEYPLVSTYISTTQRPGPPYSLTAKAPAVFDPAAHRVQVVIVVALIRALFAHHTWAKCQNPTTNETLNKLIN